MVPDRRDLEFRRAHKVERDVQGKDYAEIITNAVTAAEEYFGPLQPGFHFYADAFTATPYIWGDDQVLQYRATMTIAMLSEVADDGEDD